MFQNNATTVAEYLAGLPADRRRTIETVRTVIRRHLPKGYKEEMNWGAITYAVPLSVFPDTYNGQPLCYAALAAQKNHCSLYLMRAYGDSAEAARLKRAFKDAGKKLEMGKSCIRFKAADDLPLDAIGEIVAGTPPEAYVAFYQASRARRPKRQS
jgi:uncharacterized protein YdhG (YjbR/CyaY superfamily)